MRLKFLSETSLIEECINENKHAQKELYELYARRLFVVCYRYAGSYEEAEDLLQESFISIFNKLKNYKGDGSFEGWMKRIVIGLSIDEFRRRKNNNISFDDENNEIELVNEETPFEYLSTKDLIEMITKIPKEYRQVLNLYAIDGFSHKEIGTILDITEENSRKKLNRARNYLKKIMLDTKKESHASIDR